MARTRIKICGITRADDARAAVAAGADALGLVFYAASPRAVTVEQAAALIEAVPAAVIWVGLFVDAGRAAVAGACRRLPLQLLQFHGRERQSLCRSFGLPWVKALRVAANADLTSMMADYDMADGILLDACSERVVGGSGTVFNWQLVPSDSGHKLVLAGGLQATNVGRAIASVRPYAVDVSSGVESAAGHKDAIRMREFVAAVRATDAAGCER